MTRDPCPTCGRTSGLPVADLTPAECSYLAMYATYAAQAQDDPRYWEADPKTRAEVKRRWQEIADSLHH